MARIIALLNSKLLSLLIIIFIIIVFFPFNHPFQGLASYLPLHMAMEFFAITVSVLIFSVGWKAHQESSSDYILLSSIFLSVGIIDFIHTLTYKGMPEFFGPGHPEKAIFFWLVGRFTVSLGLLAFLLIPKNFFHKRSQRYLLLAGSLILSALTIWLGLFHLNLFPRTFIVGQGLTTFKIICEYVIVFIHIISILVLFKQLKNHLDREKIYLLRAIIIAGLSELFFTFYTNVTDLYNLSGHLYKVISYGMLYQMIFTYAIQKPYEKLRKTIEDLHISQMQLKRTQYIVDNTGDSVFLIEESGKIFWVNYSACERLGYDKHEFKSLNINMINPKLKSNKQSWFKHWNKVKENQVLLHEGTHITKSGEIYPVETISNYIIFDNIEYICSFSRDISERQQIQTQLYESEYRLREITSTLADGILVINFRKQITFCNPAIEQLFGWKEANLLYQKFDDIFQIDSHDILETVIKGQIYRQSEIILLDKDNQKRFVSLTASPIQRKEIEGAVISIHDIGELKNFSDALKTSEERFQLAVEGNQDGLWDWNIISGDVFVSPRWKLFLGYEEHEISSTFNVKLWENLVHPDDFARVFSSLNAHLSGITSEYYAEYRIRRKDNTYKWIADRGKICEFSADGKPLRAIGTLVDISMRKHMEDTLTENEQRYRSLIDVMAEGIIVQERNGRILMSNPSAERILGIKLTETVDTFHYFYIDHDALHEDFSTYDINEYPTNKTFLTGTPQRGVVLGYYIHDKVKKTREVKWISVNTQPLVKENDSMPYAIIVSFIDISNMKKAEVSLRESEQRWQFAIEGTNEGVWDWNLQTNEIFFSKRWKAIIGYDEHEFKNEVTEWQDRIHPKDWHNAWQDIIFHLKGNSEIYTSQYRLQCKDNSYKWVQTRGKLISRDQTGSPIRMIGTQSDVTQRKAIEDALRESERRFRTMADSAPMLIWVADIYKKVTWVNKSWLEFTNITQIESQLGNGWLEYIHAEDRPYIYDTYVRSFENRERFSIEFRLRHGDGEYYWMLGIGTPRYNQDNEFEGYIASCIDISKRKNLESSLKQLNETLENRVADEVHKNLEQEHLLIQQSRLAGMGEMIGNIAHQWRQPITALGAILADISDAYEYNELTKAYLDKAVHDGDLLIHKMSTTIDDFRNFFKPNKERVIFDAIDLIHKTIQLLHASLKNNNIELDINYDNTLHYKINGFPNEFSQVLLNIINNAKEAILEYHRITGKIKISCQIIDQKVIVIIQDNGGGIPSHIINNIFDPYFTTKDKGTGIGLYMSKVIIEKNMNGTINVQNLDLGAEFKIICPLHHD